MNGSAPRWKFLAARWHGLVDPGRLFFVDMLLVATTLNLVTAFLAIMALGFKWPTWAVAVVYLSPLPWNVFLVICLWRTLDLRRTRGAGAWRAAALAWLVVATLL